MNGNWSYCNEWPVVEDTTAGCWLCRLPLCCWLMKRKGEMKKSSRALVPEVKKKHSKLGKIEMS